MRNKSPIGGLFKIPVLGNQKTIVVPVKYRFSKLFSWVENRFAEDNLDTVDRLFV